MPAAFLGTVEQDLQTDADAEKRAVFIRQAVDDGDKSQFFQTGHGISCGSYSRQKDRRRCQDIFRIGSGAGCVSEVVDGVDHAAQVARPIVDYRNHISILYLPDPIIIVHPCLRGQKLCLTYGEARLNNFGFYHLILR